MKYIYNACLIVAIVLSYRLAYDLGKKEGVHIAFAAIKQSLSEVKDSGGCYDGQI